LGHTEKNAGWRGKTERLADEVIIVSKKGVEKNSLKVPKANCRQFLGIPEEERKKIDQIAKARVRLELKRGGCGGRKVPRLSKKLGSENPGFTRAIIG